MMPEENTDVRELRRRAQELESFASRIVHELKSPLGAIALRLQRIIGRGTDARTQQDVERIQAQVAVISSLIDELGEFTLELKAKPGSTAILRLINEIIGEQDGNGITFEVKGEDALAAIRPAVLYSVVSNLIRNAVKFMRLARSPQQIITVRIKPVNGTVRIEVQDTGPGVPLAIRSCLFNPYVRGDGGAPGLGLGLSIVRKFTDAYSGRVGYEPCEPGSMFWVELPRVTLLGGLPCDGCENNEKCPE